MQAFTFCDDTSGDIGPMHNPYAINNHNSRCDLRSGWSVLRDHKDFKCTVNYFCLKFIDHNDFTHIFSLKL